MQDMFVELQHRSCITLSRLRRLMDDRSIGCNVQKLQAMEVVMQDHHRVMNALMLHMYWAREASFGAARTHAAPPLGDVTLFTPVVAASAGSSAWSWHSHSPSGGSSASDGERSSMPPPPPPTPSSAAIEASREPPYKRGRI